MRFIGSCLNKKSAFSTVWAHDNVRTISSLFSHCKKYPKVENTIADLKYFEKSIQHYLIGQLELEYLFIRSCVSHENQNFLESTWFKLSVETERWCSQMINLVHLSRSFFRIDSEQPHLLFVLFFQLHLLRIPSNGAVQYLPDLAISLKILNIYKKIFV